MPEVLTGVVERRWLCNEIRVLDGEDGPPRITGYAAKFNVLSEPMTGPTGKRFRERLLPGAFSRTLASSDDVFALVEHSPNHKLGRRSTGTLELVQDEVGLRVSVTPPDTTIGRDTIAEIRRGDLSGWSFGFRASYSDQEWERSEEGMLRSLRALDLFEVTITGLPAYPKTELALRSQNFEVAERFIQEWESKLQQQLEAEAIAQAEARARHLLLIGKR